MKYKSQSGYVMVIALLVFFGIFTIGMGLVSRSSALLTMQENTKKKIQSFYSSDGQMTLLAQEVIDGKGDKYRSNNFLIYEKFTRPDNEVLDSGWVEVESDIGNRVRLTSGRTLIYSNGDIENRPILKKTFPLQTSDTLVWQFTTQWKRSDINYTTFAVYFQLGNNMSDDDPWSNVAVNLRWGDNSATGYSSDEMFGYVSSLSSLQPSGKGLKILQTSSNIKVIVYLNRYVYDILIDGKQYAKNIPFFKDKNNITEYEINQIRILPQNLDNSKFSGCSIDNISLLKKAADSYSATDELNYGDFSVSYEILEEELDMYTITTKSFFKDAPTLNKYRTPLYQSIENRGGTVIDFPDSVDIPVRFYDFHSNRSNLEFEQPTKGGLMKKMVKSKLDIDGKPVRSNIPANLQLNYYIQYWFRETDPSNNTQLIPYQYSQDANDWSIYPKDTTATMFQIPDGTKATRAVKDAFANIVIDTFLTFTHQGSGVYQFRRLGFFPLDNKGFGKEPTWDRNPLRNGYTTDIHNFSFTMEMTHSFVKIPGQYFKFSGDDDVWVFVNDSLVLDIGGKKGEVADSFFVDDLTNLNENTAYTMKVFYCERHTTSSNITITTNLVLTATAPIKSRSWGRNYGNIY